ncbi:MAG: sulfotransferase [Thermoplasmatota archaeon]
MATPIFGLGLARNGTTWLENILCNHEDIVGAQHKAHWGIKESYICENIQHWGDFQDDDQFIRFLELYSSGDYFKLVEGEKDYFYKNRPEDFTEFFLELMDNYAKKKGAAYWTTKLDPAFYRNPELMEMFMNRIKNRYNEIKFIAIQRDFRDVLNSAINMPGAGWRRKLLSRQVFAIFNTVQNAHGYNKINQIIDEHDGLKLQFEDLKGNRSITVEKIVNYLDLDHSEGMLEDHYLPNSSYIGKTEKVTLSSWEEKLITKHLFSILNREDISNSIFTSLMDRSLDHLIPKNRLIHWRLTKLERFPDKYKEDLEKKGSVGLKRALFGDEDG